MHPSTMNLKMTGRELGKKERKEERTNHEDFVELRDESLQEILPRRSVEFLELGMGSRVSSLGSLRLVQEPPDLHGQRRWRFQVLVHWTECRGPLLPTSCSLPIPPTSSGGHGSSRGSDLGSGARARQSGPAEGIAPQQDGLGWSGMV